MRPALRGWRSKNDKAGCRHRRATVLICVMVVLLLVGMLSVQAMQSLVISRRSSSERAKLLQARELIELGRIVQRRSDATDVPNSFEVQLGQAGTGNVRILLSDASRGSGNYRIEATFPTGEAGEVSASWEFRESEQ